VRHGWPFKSEHFQEELTGHPIVVNIGNFEYSGGFRFENTTLKEYRGDFPREYILKPEEILVIMTCQTAGGEILGVPGRIPNDGRIYLHNQRMGRVEIKQPSRIDLNFVYYLFLLPDFNRHLYSTASGTKILHTSPGRIEDFHFPLPPLKVQQSLGSILRCLDDKIELNRRMNETLESMARAIFKSWFVDFDPVRAKAAGRPPSGMDADTAALFPSSFEDSPIGKIPKGWTAGAATDFARLNPEAWSKKTAPEQIEYVDLSNTKWGKIESTANHLWKDAPSRAQRILRPGDTIIGTVRPGNGAYALIDRDGLTGSTGFAVLRPLKPEFTEFVYLASTAKDNIERLAHLADGAAYPAVRPEVVAATAIVTPEPDIISEFSHAVRALIDRMASSDRESRTLATIRDALLPKLISGEIRIKDAEKMVREKV
jgi:type I restriction enzyme S subunit